MRAVLYSDDDMEPITVIELPQWAADMIGRGLRVRFPASPVMTLESSAAFAAPRRDDCRIVEVWGERFIRKGESHLMLFTKDEVTAMLLRADFLPGQQREVQHRARLEFIRGLLAAFPSE